MTTCILLAAGSASRMNPGRHRRSNRDDTLNAGSTFDTDQPDTPKMLLPYNGKTFLQHAIDEVQHTQASALVVVSGYYHSLIEPILALQKIAVVENKNWQEGIGSSIQAGVAYTLIQYPATTNIILLVCDQPFISTSLLNQLMATASESTKGIVAAAYSNTLGTPVLFSKKYFECLLALNGNTGAKKIIQQFQNDVAMVEFPAGAIDIDTPEDYVAL